MTKTLPDGPAGDLTNLLFPLIPKSVVKTVGKFSEVNETIQLKIEDLLGDIRV